MVQEDLETADDHAKACAMGRLDGCAKMAEQGLDFAPMDVGTRRVAIDRFQEVQVLVAHIPLP